MTIRSRFGELKAELLSRAAEFKVRTENFDFVILSCKTTPGGENETEEGFHLANMRYSAVIYIERVPADLLAWFSIVVQAWLNEHDDTRMRAKLADPDTDFTDNGDGFVDIYCTLEFLDPIHLTRADDDETEAVVTWFGRKFKMGEYTYNVADEVVDVTPRVAEDVEDAHG